jgi:hypothetical protein
MTPLIYIAVSIALGMSCYAMGFVAGARAQRLDHRRWRERQIRWREFEDL